MSLHDSAHIYSLATRNQSAQRTKSVGQLTDPRIKGTAMHLTDERRSGPAPTFSVARVCLPVLCWIGQSRDPPTTRPTASARTCKERETAYIPSPRFASCPGRPAVHSRAPIASLALPPSDEIYDGCKSSRVLRLLTLPPVASVARLIDKLTPPMQVQLGTRVPN